MIISDVTQKLRGNTITVSATVTFDHRDPETLYFSLHKKWHSALSVDATPFVAALLIPCMKRGEDISVDGSSISPVFLKQTKKVMDLLLKWDKRFHQISIESKTKSVIRKKRENASFFSGGVDSFYTYIKSKRKKSTKITSFLFVHGFDIELENSLFFTSVRNGLQKVADEEGVDLITLQTNVKRITDTYVDWDWAHGGALASIALLLQNKLSTVSIPGALRKDQLFPYGTHPLLDPLWGTEQLQFIHDGIEYDRLDKVITTVGKSQLALTHLRVCNQNLKGKYNCSRCFKCLWTMMTLECAGSLVKSSTFNYEIDLERVKKMRYNYALNYHLAGKRVIAQLKKNNKRKDLQEAVKISLEKSKKTSLKQSVAKKIAIMDKKYNNRRLFKTIFSLNNNQDRKFIFKILSRQGIIK
jgi:hypothetical protein